MYGQWGQAACAPFMCEADITPYPQLPHTCPNPLTVIRRVPTAPESATHIQMDLVCALHIQAVGMLCMVTGKQ